MKLRNLHKSEKDESQYNSREPELEAETSFSDVGPGIMFRTSRL